MNERFEKVRIIVLFGDLSGFTDFCESVTNDEIEYDPFMAKFDHLIDQAERETGYTFSSTGDGFMCTVDLLSSGHNCTTAIEVLKNLWSLFQQILRLIQTHKRLSVAPDGFRIVGDSGYVKRKVKRDGRVVDRGKHINRAHNLLDFARGKGFVCTDTLKQLISDQQAKRHDFKFTSIGKRLWSLEIGR
jgi:class 3 adenylate cyclase